MGGGGYTDAPAAEKGSKAAAGCFGEGMKVELNRLVAAAGRLPRVAIEPLASGILRR